jgi:hypothetical protein
MMRVATTGGVFACPELHLEPVVKEDHVSQVMHLVRTYPTCTVFEGEPRVRRSKLACRLDVV